MSNSFYSSHGFTSLFAHFGGKCDVLPCCILVYSSLTSATYLRICLLNHFKPKQEAIFGTKVAAEKHIPAETQPTFYKWGWVCDTKGMHAACALTVSSAFITFYSVILIKSSNQIIRSSGFDSTAGWTGFVKLIKHMFCVVGSKVIFLQSPVQISSQ